jgi:hypothetical protein
MESRFDFIARRQRLSFIKTKRWLSHVKAKLEQDNREAGEFLWRHPFTISILLVPFQPRNLLYGDLLFLLSDICRVQKKPTIANIRQP